jgi:hypothetical protein
MNIESEILNEVPEPSRNRGGQTVTAPSGKDFAGEFATSLFVVHSSIAIYIADGEFEKASQSAEALASTLRRLLAIEKRAGKAANTNRPRPPL